jgi:glycosyltransferase involved in cell wall biosynthesis
VENVAWRNSGACHSGEAAAAGVPCEDHSAGAACDDRVNVSVFVMTRDEETNIVRCLESVRWSNDVVLLDSGSADATLDLARRFENVRIFHREFTDYADQRNHGLRSIAYRNDWVFVVDADEVVEPALAAEILNTARAARNGAGPAAYMVRRRPVLGGKVLRRNVSAHFWIARLLRVGKVNYHGRVHERVAVAGTVGRLRGRLEHHQFSKGIENWYQRRLHYARLELDMAAAGEIDPISWRDFFSRDHFKRRAVLKSCFMRMPLKWLVYFLYNIVVTGAFLEGRKGLTYVWLETQSYRRSARLRMELGAC